MFSELEAIIKAVEFAAKLFPIVSALVHHAETIAPTAPGNVKLNNVLATVQSGLDQANVAAETAAAIPGMVTTMVTGIKAQMNSVKEVSNSPAVQVPQ